jgi:hypothetical protein
LWGLKRVTYLQRTEYRRTNGLCVACGKLNTRLPKKTCHDCAERGSANYYSLRRKGNIGQLKQSLAQSKEGHGRLSDPFKALAIAVFSKALEDLASRKTSPQPDRSYPTQDEKDSALKFLQPDLNSEWATIHEHWFSYLKDDMAKGILQNKVNVALSGGNSFRVEAS